jgi:branched-chain amino acid transport system ATP-binding protein
LETIEQASPEAVSSDGAAILTVRGLVSGYGRIQTLHGIDATVPRGKSTVIIGPNGSGKSTFLKSVSGQLKPQQGSVLFDGENVAGMAAHSLVPRGMCVIPQGRVVFPYLTVEENLVTNAFTVKSRDLVQERLAEAYDFLPLLAERRSQLASNMSGGEQVLLSIAKAIMLKPRLLLLDEPSLGLSPKMIDFVYDRIGRLTSDGLTTLIVEQNVKKAMAVANHVIVLVLGNVRFEGSPQVLESTIDLGTLFLEGKVR